jgi:two-component system cell cycle sensor histidine kinase/response regulator CckA
MSGSLQILIVDDSQADAKLVARALTRRDRAVQFERVEDVETMRKALQEKKWDVVVSDWRMPKFSALDALGCVKDMGIDVPFVIVSGTVGEEIAVEAMRAGADDFVLKDRLTRLAPAVDRELTQSRGREAGRRTQDALRSSEARFMRLWDSGVVGITIGEFLGPVQEANDTFLRLVGYSQGELRAGGLRWAEMTPPEWRNAEGLALQLLESQGFAPAWETELLRKDGERVPVVVGVAMLEYPTCIGVVADLTERKRAEKALGEMERQLRQAQKMEAIALLAGGVAHDFNNILSVILSYAGMLLNETQPGDPMRESLEEIRQAGQRAAVLTRQLLLFSRHKVVEPTVLDLNQILTGLDKMIRRIVGEDVELVLAAEAQVGRVIGDPGQIEQVVMNLVVNSRDAMPTGGKLTLETANVTLDQTFSDHHLGVKPGSYVMLAVTDSGIGMSKETQARIFEPFFTTKETGKGTGIGLSMVFGIVKQCGGSVWVYSEPGIGTTFKIYFPRSAREPDEVRKFTPPSVLTGTETILLVEDEEQVRGAARSILARNGYNVVEVMHSAEALEVCGNSANLIDIVLTDVVMPQMSGPELVRRLVELRPEIKVLCMSGYTDETIERHGMLDSKMAFLEKPFTPEALLSKVREVLDGHH